MRHDLTALGQQRGKTFVSLWYVQWAMATGKTVAIGTSRAELLSEYIKEVFPEVKLAIEDYFIVINPKVKA